MRYSVEWSGGADYVNNIKLKLFTFRAELLHLPELRWWGEPSRARPLHGQPAELPQPGPSFLQDALWRLGPSHLPQWTCHPSLPPSRGCEGSQDQSGGQSPQSLYQGSLAPSPLSSSHPPGCYQPQNIHYERLVLYWHKPSQWSISCHKQCFTMNFATKMLQKCIFF